MTGFILHQVIRNLYSRFVKDMQILEFSSPRLAANSVSAHFTGDRESAAVLDVACGTGLVAEQVKLVSCRTMFVCNQKVSACSVNNKVCLLQLRQHGFTHFVGVDGSKSMLEIARKKGLYEDLKECLLGDQPLPLPKGWEFVMRHCKANHSLEMLRQAGQIEAIPFVALRTCSQAN